jgi:hypothetical protein
MSQLSGASGPDLSGDENRANRPRSLRHPQPPADDGLVTRTRSFLYLPGRIGSSAALTTRRVLLLALAAALSCAFLVAAAPAGAIVSEVNGNNVGLQPRDLATVLDGNGATGASFDNFNGNPVLHSNSTYAIYWDPANTYYHGDWQAAINKFFKAVGTDSGGLDNVFGVDAQYTDRSNLPASYNSTFKGAFVDTNHYPASGCTDPHPLAEADRIVVEKVPTALCFTNTQIQQQLQTFIAQHSLPKGMNSVFYLMTPIGVTVCLDAGTATGHCSDYTGTVGEASYTHSFCSYHSDINPGGLATGSASTILYAAIPWTAGGLGDPDLLEVDQRSGSDCQDGGFDPSSKPPEKKEKKTEKNTTEKAAFTAMDKEEKEKVEKAEALEEPHPQEPNQVPCPSEDGGCDSGLADLIINQIAVEQQNIVTNPLLNAWQDSAHNEATDECRNWFAPVLGGSSGANEGTASGSLFNQVIDGGPYYLNSAFDRSADTLTFPGIPCLTDVTLEPHFTAPNPVNAGELVGFDGMESNISLGSGINFPSAGERQTTYATFTWNFGDGTPEVSGFAPGSPSANSPEAAPCESPWLLPCAGSTYHAYQYGGTYPVTLTVRDVGGNVASATKDVTIVGPAPPQPAPAPSPNVIPPTPPGASTSTTTVAGAAGSAAHAGPVATQAVTGQKLTTVLRGGLVVRYSVNEQVAGRFEVMLASSIARQLGLHGTPATGLAKGTLPQTVIAKAVLVTTKGGHSTYKIHFSKTTAAKLKRLKKVLLTLRLVVHNASSGTTTILNKVTLTN